EMGAGAAAPQARGRRNPRRMIPRSNIIRRCDPAKSLFDHTRPPDPQTPSARGRQSSPRDGNTVESRQFSIPLLHSV
ncbi:hypothetical protein, partial [Cupriavidus sp. HPC(L)]|uniref:hypothetical protein n=1 Tax=Cupriavidus sp. HPC(L) TaxID=1217418 RepID=UPI001C125224